mmetsp:Transcript_102147/g.234049  ORF Transcript_102147/g.234049 Transcript_102147/m.234049 type:complete len:517 (+) Transcript_102147:38-1588(+)
MVKVTCYYPSSERIPVYTNQPTTNAALFLHVAVAVVVIRKECACLPVHRISGMAPLMDRIFRNVYPQNDGEKIALFYTPGKKETGEQIARRKWFRLAGALSLVCLLLGCFTLMGRNHKNASAVLHSAGIIDRYPRIDSRLIFVDDFDGDAIDDTKWTVEEDLGGGGNGEVQFYRNHPDNIGVANGMLYIKPGRLTDLGDVETPAGTYPIQEVMTGDCEPWPGCANFLLAPNQCTNALWGGCNKTGNVPPGNVIQPATSGRLNSNGKFSFQYGRIEVRARLPRGNWLWPAIWMLPTVFTYGNWPTSGEIDLVESRGNNPDYLFGGKPAGRNFAGQTLHFGPAETRTGDGWPHAHAELRSPPARGDFTEEFYTYGAYWAEDAMYLYIVDPGGVEHLVLDLTQGFANGFWEPPLGFAGRPKWKNVTMANPYAGRPLNAPYDKPFYLIMNVAVGGELYWDSPWDAACKEELRAAAEEGAGSPPPCSSNRWFYDHEDAWWPSWQAAGAQNTMEVDWVKVWQ